MLRSSKIEIAHLPPTRDLARTAGANFYFTGQPCRRGHSAPRYTSTTQCVDCQFEHYRRKAPPRQRATLEQMRARTPEIIKERGGRLLSTELTSAKDKIQVMCADSHVFETSYDRLCQGNWCRQCGDASKAAKLLGYTVEDMQRVAVEQGGQFRSPTFNGVKEKHEWLCPEHGSFWATPDNILNSNQWCPGCWENRRGKTKRRPIDYVLGRIRERGGQLVSPIEEYETLKSRVRVRCADGYEWEVAAASLVGANSWCPECQGTAGETITRRIFEATYGVPFPKCRPDFLRTNVGGYLELDGYNADLALAFEYQGPFHERPDQIGRDREKRERCEALGIRLFEVPFVKNPYPPEKVLSVVADVIKAVNPDRKAILPDEDLFPQKLRPLLVLARSHGGRLVSDRYLGAHKKLVWTCGDPDHPPWKATPEQVVRLGTWCPHCAGVARKDIDWLRKFGKEHSLTLVDASYGAANRKYGWKCNHSHEFKDAKANILQRVGKGKNACPICAETYRTVTISDLRQAAVERGGECLAANYKNAHALLIWRCGHGHEFTRTWNKIQQGYWCASEGCPDNRRWQGYNRFKT